jgi:hypothetical protein
MLLMSQDGMKWKFSPVIQKRVESLHGKGSEAHSLIDSHEVGKHMHFLKFTKRHPIQD